MRILRTATFLILGTALGATPSAAQRAPRAGADSSRPGVVADWTSRLKTASDALHASEWQRGARIADSGLCEMRERISSGEGTAAFLAVALLYRAIGRAGAGDLHEAAWDFGVAQSFYPDYEKVDLAPFGIAGERLEPWRFSRRVFPLGSAFEAARIEPPRKLRGDAPSYPAAKRGLCVDGPIVVQAVIDEEGRLGYPTLTSAVDPILGLAAFEAVRDWRFAPARSGWEAGSGVLQPHRELPPAKLYGLIAQLE